MRTFYQWNCTFNSAANVTTKGKCSGPVIWSKWLRSFIRVQGLKGHNPIVFTAVCYISYYSVTAASEQIPTRWNEVEARNLAQ